MLQGVLAGGNGEIPRVSVSLISIQRIWRIWWGGRLVPEEMVLHQFRNVLQSSSGVDELGDWSELGWKWNNGDGNPCSTPALRRGDRARTPAGIGLMEVFQVLS